MDPGQERGQKKVEECGRPKKNHVSWNAISQGEILDCGIVLACYAPTVGGELDHYLETETSVTIDGR